MRILYIQLYSYYFQSFPVKSQHPFCESDNYKLANTKGNRKVLLDPDGSGDKQINLGPNSGNPSTRFRPYKSIRGALTHTSGAHQPIQVPNVNPSHGGVDPYKPLRGTIYETLICCNKPFPNPCDRSIHVLTADLARLRTTTDNLMLVVVINYLC